MIISTPGRICLFGEHQDYLNLPVIASAISLRINVEGSPRNDKQICISLPDINSVEKIHLNGKLKYVKERDYFRSGLNVLLDEGFTFSSGFDCVIHGEIPINAGTSSSSALIISWINFLSRMSDQKEILHSSKLAALGYKAEVLEFGEPGGMMDHYSTALGGLIYLQAYPEIKIENLSNNLGAFVLGDSGEPKNTKEILASVKNGVISLVDRLKTIQPSFLLQKTELNSLTKTNSYLNQVEYELLKGTLQNRDITVEAKKQLSLKEINKKVIGELLNRHQKILKDVLKISTEKIDLMVEAALNAGAYGAKINGSGGGGCMFAYAPDNPERVMEAVLKYAKRAYIIYPDDGSKEILE